jgi:hypothetical protein
VLWEDARINDQRSEMEHEQQLRAWAKGMYPLEAATELLIRAFGGRFAAPGKPWVHTEDGHPWVDFEAIPDHIGALSGGERRMLLLISSLGGGEPVDLNDVLPALDRGNLELVLAAVAHAAGSHEQSDARSHEDGTFTLTRLESLHPWPVPPANLRMVPPAE